MITPRKPTVTVTLAVDTAAALQKMLDHYGSIATTASCATAALEAGLAVYSAQHGFEVSPRLRALFRPKK